MSRIKPEPTPVLGARGLLTGVLRSLPAEQVRQCVAIDACTAVVYGELGHPILRRAEADLDAASVRSEMNGAAEEADQRLPQPGAVGEKLGGKRFELNIEIDGFRARLPGRLHGGVHELSRVDGRELQLQVARQQTPCVHDFVDEIEL